MAKNGQNCTLWGSEAEAGLGAGKTKGECGDSVAHAPKEKRKTWWNSAKLGSVLSLYFNTLFE